MLGPMDPRMVMGLHDSVGDLGAECYRNPRCKLVCGKTKSAGSAQGPGPFVDQDAPYALGKTISCCPRAVANCKGSTMTNSSSFNEMQCS